MHTTPLPLLECTCNLSVLLKLLTNVVDTVLYSCAVLMWYQWWRVPLVPRSPPSSPVSPLPPPPHTTKPTTITTTPRLTPRPPTDTTRRQRILHGKKLFRPTPERMVYPHSHTVSPTNPSHKTHHTTTPLTQRGVSATMSLEVV